MSLVLLLLYSVLNMFRMLIRPSSGACDYFVELLHGLYLVRCVLVLRCSVAMVVWYPSAGWSSASACRRKERTSEKRKPFELISGMSFEPGSNRNETWSRLSIQLNVVLCDLHILHIRTECPVHTWLWVVYGMQFWGVVESVEFIHPPIQCMSRALSPS